MAADGILRIGDRILAVEDRAARELDVRALREMACRTERLRVKRKSAEAVEVLDVPTARIPSDEE